jgi:DNA-directed RNA polymerase subunit RPC12/RpoP
MSIEFRCSQCSQLLRVPDNSAGKNARCPKCQALMVVPVAVAIVQSVAPASSPPTLPPAAEPPPPFQTSYQPPPPPPPVSDPPKFAPPPVSDFPKFAPQPAVNPYLSPAASPQQYAPAHSYHYDIERPGLPWENEPRTLGCYMRTASVIVGSPSRAFSIMRRHGDLGSPMLYAMFGYGLPFAILTALVVAVLIIGLLVFAIAEGGKNAGATGVVGGVSFVVLILVVAYGAFSILLEATLGNLIRAAIIHVLLMIVGGARQSYETTFRVLSFSQGAILWSLFIPIPIVNILIWMIWSIVLLIIGLSRSHEITAGKAALAVMLPIVICGGLYGAMMLLAIGGALTQK